MTKKLRHGSLFSGVGGVDLGLSWVGFETVWQVELDPFARRVLEKHWPGVRRLEDVRECGKDNLEPVDIISGGFPCVDVSVAGKKLGLGTADSPTERSGLWFEYRRIISELRPRWVLIENVSRLLDTADGETVLNGLEEIGYSWWPQLLDAGALGAPHRRERAWILCYDNAHGDWDIEAVMTETGVLPPECQRRMEEALGKWNYWKHELGRGASEGCPAITTTPTATAVLEAHWPGGRVYQNAEGRWRKRSKKGTEGSASWPQEMLVRAVRQRNPRLVPTPESCEEFMGFPRGWTRLAEEATSMPEELTMEWGEEPDAYAKIVRGVHGIPHWSERVKALGNAVVVQVPMIIGACVQRYESRLPTAAHAWAVETNGDGWGGSLPAQGMPEPQNSRHLSPVERRYETLGVEGTKKAYRDLNAALEGLACTVVQTLEQIAPYLGRMQSLLSQRGADRKMVLKKAGLPAWTKWAEGYAASLRCTVRTIQRHILQGREDRGRLALGPGTAAEKGTGGSGVPKQARLDARQQAALLKAQMAANELAVALTDGADWHAALAEFERVAVTPDRLETYLSALEREPDWKAMLVKLVNALETCGDTLPYVVKDAMNAAQDQLGGGTNGEATCPGPSWPTIPYPGGKGRLAPALVSFMPPKGRLYLEPFVGRGNVFWAAASKALSFQKWSLNDIRTAPFFEALRTIGGTVEVPARSREEYYRQWEGFKQGDLRAILLEPYLTFSGGGYGCGGFGGRKSADALGYTKTIRACHSLIVSTGVGVTSLDWTKLDWSSLGADDFVYLDPPYLGADVRPYKQGDVSHEELVHFLKGARFRWMLSGYGHELYFRELGQPFYAEGTRLATANPRLANSGEERRLECVWKNY